MSLDFPDGSAVKTLHFHCRGMGSIPGWGTKIWTQREKKSWLSRKGKTEFQRAFTKGQGHLVSDKTAKPMVSHHYYMPSFFGCVCVCVCGPFFMVFPEFVTILLLSYALGFFGFFCFFWLRGMWDPRSPTRIKPTLPALEAQS